MDVTALMCVPLANTALELPAHMTVDDSSEAASFGFGECTAGVTDPWWGTASDTLLRWLWWWGVAAGRQPLPPAWAEPAMETGTQVLPGITTPVGVPEGDAVTGGWPPWENWEERRRGGKPVVE